MTSSLDFLLCCIKYSISGLADIYFWHDTLGFSLLATHRDSPAHRGPWCFTPSWGNSLFGLQYIAWPLGRSFRPMYAHSASSILPVHAAHLLCHGPVDVRRLRASDAVALDTASAGGSPRGTPLWYTWGAGDLCISSFWWSLWSPRALYPHPRNSQPDSDWLIKWPIPAYLHLYTWQVQLTLAAQPELSYAPYFIIHRKRLIETSSS